MEKQTAVDFLFKSIYGGTGHFDAYTTQGTPAYDAYKQAKAIEKEQMTTFAKMWESKIFDGSIDSVDDYYKETYGGDK